MKAEDIRITKHVIERYRERTRSKATDDQIRNKLLKYCQCGTKLKHLDGHYGWKHRKNVIFILYENFTLIVKRGVLVTMYLGTPTNWNYYKGEIEDFPCNPNQNLL